MSKKSGANAVDDLRETTRNTRGDLGDTVTALRERTDLKMPKARKAGGWAGAALGVVAGAAALAALRWRQNRSKPKNRAERMWRDVKGRVRKTAARIG